MNWLRLHHEARTDKKLAALSDAQFRVWFNLLCFSGEQPERGRIGFDDIDVLAIEVAGGDAALLQATIERLVKLKMIDGTDGTVAFTNFEKRQYDKPSDAPERVAERVKKHRQHQRNADVTPSNAIDTDTDTESKTETEQPDEGLPTGDAPHADATPIPADSVITSHAEPKPKAEKPRTPGQAASDKLFHRRVPMVYAYFRGAGIDPEGIAGKQRFRATMKEFTTEILDAPECTPKVIEALTRYAIAAYQWREGNRTPSIHDVFKALPDWDREGRPDTPAPKPNGHAPPGNQPGYRPKFNGQGQRVWTMADLREEEKHERERNPETVVEAPSRVVPR